LKLVVKSVQDSLPVINRPNTDVLALHTEARHGNTSWYHRAGLATYIGALRDHGATL
jgi:hypothetical protein